jgi:hypothetical protein
MANKKQVFYSFHFDNDVMRVQQIRNIGAIEDNKPVSVNDWEQVRRGGAIAIQKWIDENMKYKNCVVVLVGSQTADREWVRYEIKKAWNDGRGLVGIYIHNIKCPRNGLGRQGKNPFDQFTVKGKSLSSTVQCYNPNSYDAYGDIKNNLEKWVDEAISIRNNYQ